jgi:hypothetical protein
MRYQMPNYPCEFEIPDAWVTEAGMDGFSPTAQAYRSTLNAVLVPLREIEPPYRTPWTPKDARGFERARLVAVLNGIATGSEIEPVPLLKLPSSELLSRAPYGYRVLDGFHRFYASIVAGFECLPGMIK